MTVNIGRLRQAMNTLPKYPLTLDHAGQEYVRVVIVAALQEEISFYYLRIKKKVILCCGRRISRLRTILETKVAPFETRL